MWKLDYDGALLMRFPPETTITFRSSAFFKLSLKRYVQDVFEGFVRFKPALTYLDYKRVIALCEKETAKKGFELCISNSLSEFIESREVHVEIRSRLGNEIKNQDPKLLERFEIYRQTVDSCMTRKLRNKQMWDSFFMCSMQKSANFSVPGSGKTSSVLGMYSYLHSKGIIKRIVVICPKNAFGSWVDEFHACFDGIEQLHVLNVHDVIYKNTAQKRNALRYDSGGCNLILVNYESVGSLIEELIDIVDSSTLLVFDEVHKVKRVHGTHAENALRVAKNANYVVAMTGTPIPNSYTDIYNLLHILFPDEYDEFFDFSVPLLRNPNVKDIKEINDKLQPFFCRTTKQQLGVPQANKDSVHKLNPTETENRLLKILRMKYRHNKLALLIRILQMESNPKLLLQSIDLKDFAYLIDEDVDIDEIDHADYSEEVKQLIESCGVSTKFKHCIDLIELLVNAQKPVVVWCMFIDTIRRMEKELQQRGLKVRCVYGEVPLEERQEIINNFKDGKIQILVTNPHTLAESISLHSVCHDAVYFEYSYNLVHLLQSKDRIHRLGLPDNQYTQYYYMQQFYDIDGEKWSMNEAVYNRLMEKEKIMLDAIDNHVLEALPTSDEDLEVIFSKLF